MDDAAVDQLRAQFGAANVVYDAAFVDKPEQLLAAAADCDALIVRNRTQVRGELLEALAKARVVGRLGVGLDNIDVAACEARNLKVIPATGANALAVAEYVIGTAMMLRRASYLSTAAVAAGKWPRAALSNGRETAGSTLGLIGFGSIGQLTAQLARAVGMTVIAYDPVITDSNPAWMDTGAIRMALDDVIRDSDVLSLHVPLVDSTKNLMNAERIATMKNGAILINTARGGIVDDAALAAALRSGHLGGAAIDVFTQEPLPASDVFAGCPNLVLTPHIAGVSAEANVRVSSMIADAVIRELV
ncbi:MAG: 3-phosphoglycerate dehydrogenase [Burkholderiales bacterium]|nr:MAG: 3-phosphoglycerate dehydrogenase [Burkholderiales bacterium]TAG81249.1 MAG: 3-phosphoglycerate dehydrogenase [Betaproteobacteria bacterium]